MFCPCVLSLSIHSTLLSLYPLILPIRSLSLYLSPDHHLTLSLSHLSVLHKSYTYFSLLSLPHTWTHEQNHTIFILFLAKYFKNERRSFFFFKKGLSYDTGSLALRFNCWKFCGLTPFLLKYAVGIYLFRWIWDFGLIILWAALFPTNLFVQLIIGTEYHYFTIILCLRMFLSMTLNVY